MRRAVLACALLCAASVPATAQELSGQALCAAVWSDLSAAMSEVFPTTGRLAPMEDDWCEFEAVRVDTLGTYAPDVLADRLRLRGSGLDWSQDGTTPPERLELAIDGLHFVVALGHPQMDYLMAAQARGHKIGVEAALAWSPAGRDLDVERLEIDFPGASRVSLSARAKGVDLSTTGAAQMSATSFAVTSADLLVTTHGLFEAYLLMPLGTAFLPYEGDMLEAEILLRSEALARITALPDAVFPPASKEALKRLVADLPNPSGSLTVALRSEAGVGPARLTGFAMTGMPDTLAGATPLFDGVTLDIGWTHEETPGN